MRVADRQFGHPPNYVVKPVWRFPVINATVKLKTVTNTGADPLLRDYVLSTV